MESTETDMKPRKTSTDDQTDDISMNASEHSNSQSSKITNLQNLLNQRLHQNGNSSSNGQNGQNSLSTIQNDLNASNQNQTQLSKNKIQKPLQNQPQTRFPPTHVQPSQPSIYIFDEIFLTTCKDLAKYGYNESAVPSGIKEWCSGKMLSIFPKHIVQQIFTLLLTYKDDLQNLQGNCHANGLNITYNRNMGNGMNASNSANIVNTAANSVNIANSIHNIINSSVRNTISQNGHSAKSPGIKIPKTNASFPSLDLQQNSTIKENLPTPTSTSRIPSDIIDLVDNSSDTDETKTAVDKILNDKNINSTKNEKQLENGQVYPISTDTLSFLKDLMKKADQKIDAKGVSSESDKSRDIFEEQLGAKLDEDIDATNSEKANGTDISDENCLPLLPSSPSVDHLLTPSSELLDPRRWRCNYCPKARPKSYGRSQHLSRHIRESHAEIYKMIKYSNTYPCFHCNEIFDNRNNRTAHLRSRHGELYPFHCELCKDDSGSGGPLTGTGSPMFEYERKYIAHMREVHMNERDLPKVLRVLEERGINNGVLKETVDANEGSEDDDDDDKPSLLQKFDKDSFYSFISLDTAELMFSCQI